MELYRGSGGQAIGKNNGAIYYTDSIKEAKCYGNKIEKIELDNLSGFDEYTDDELMTLLENSEEEHYKHYDGTIGAEMLAIDIARNNGKTGVVFHIDNGEFDPDCKLYVAIIKN